MKVMVTGANGFLGSNLLNKLTQKDIDVVAVVRSSESDISKIADLRRVKIVTCPLEEMEELPRLVQDEDIELCIDFAWNSANGPKRSDVRIQMDNVANTVTLCESLAKLGVKRFVGIGTLAEREVMRYLPTDGATPGPMSFYGVAKAGAEYMSKIICTQLGIEHIWCRLSNVYGVGDRTNNFVNFASRRMLSGERAAFTAGEQMYDFMYVTDIVEAICAVAFDGKNNTEYYVGSGAARPLKEYIIEIRDCIDPSIELFLGEIPFNGVSLPQEEFDSSKLFEDTGFRPAVNFEEGIAKTVEWLRSSRKA